MCLAPEHSVKHRVRVRVQRRGYARTYVRADAYVCVWALACTELWPVGPSMTAEVGTIICSAVISINTFLDAHTASQRSCAQLPPRM